MVKWLDIVKKHAKLNPGKSLKEYLPHAKAEWDQLKKSGQVVVASASKAVKSVKIGGKSKKNNLNDLSSVSQEQGLQAAAVMATSVGPSVLMRGKTRARGKSKTRNGGKGKNGKSRTRRIAGKGKSRGRGKSRSKTGGKKNKQPKSGIFDITNTNLK